MNERNYIKVSFDDERPMIRAVKTLLEANEIILDVRTPFPLHSLDKLLSMKRTRIPVGGFIFGVFGAISAFGFMVWVFTVSYPLIIGGKPYFAAPSFIPITFECTVLFAGLSMVVALLVRSRLKPDIYFTPDDDRITDDRFIIIIDTRHGATTVEKVRSVLSGIQNIEIK
jgi:hypothetical protein